MWKFIGQVLRNLAALFAAYFILVVLSVFLIMALGVGEEQRAANVPQGAVLAIDLDCSLIDSPPQEEPLQALQDLMGNDSSDTLSLKPLLDGLRAAGRDERISGLFLKGSLIRDGWSSNFASLREVRGALEDFKKSGKPVVAFLDNPTLADYYLCSAATEIHIHPFGAILMQGMSWNKMYFARGFEKFGIGVQPVVVGKYKSGIEPYTRDSMSEADREALTALLDGLWSDVVDGIAASRGIDPAQVREISANQAILQPDQALASHLVDKVTYWDEMLLRLEKIGGRDEDAETFQQVSFDEYQREVAEKPAHGDQDKTSVLAIVYAEGVIVDGRGDAGEIGGDRMAKRLRKMRQDDAIKAVVLRVNSPGGSAHASEVILRELRELQKKKPVVVSMGGVAASGGYWISSECQYIFATPTTIAGSIGVYGLIPHIGEMAGHLGITFDGVKTSPMADLFTLTRPKTPAEMAVYQGFVDRIYTEFLERVSRGRKMPVENVHEIAQGRAWTGADAVKLGLVDEIGGLPEALAKARSLAGLPDDCRVESWPRQKTLLEALSQMLDEGSNPLAARGPLSRTVVHMEKELQKLSREMDPRGIYLRLPFEPDFQ